MADAVAAMLYILFHGENGAAYNIANDHCHVRLKDFAQACAGFVGSKVVFDRPSDIERSGYSIATNAILCANKLLGLGFIPRYTFEDAIKRTLSILHSCHIEK